MPINAYYEAGETREYNYLFGASGSVQDYRIILDPQTDFDISSLVNIKPNFFEKVPGNSGGEFKITLNFEEESIPPGRHEALAVVQQTKSSNGMISALAEVAIRIRIVSLYPTEYLDWSFNAKNANTGEDVQVTASLSNWGMPEVEGAQITYRLYDSQNNFIKEIISSSKNIESKKTERIETIINTAGLLPDDYKLIGKLIYGDQENTKEKIFRLGNKNILINDMTREFVPESINKVEVEIESGWNDNIEEVNGRVEVSEEGILKNSFNLFDRPVEAWKKATMDGYFDTSGMEIGEYQAEVILSYDGEESKKTFEIIISENSGTETVEQIPGSFNIKEQLTVQNGIIILLIIILGMNIWYLVDRRKH